MQHRVRHSRGQSLGFTLVEIIAVVAVFGILATLLMSQIPRMIERAGEARCVSNLQSIGKAVSFYAVDHQLNLPPGNSDSVEWFRLNATNSWLKDYGGSGSEETARKLLRCPVDRTKKEPYASYRFYYSYSINSEQLLAYTQGTPAHGRAPVKLLNARRKILVTDGVSNAENPGLIPSYPQVLALGNASQRMSRRHLQGANALFGDGSVAWVFPDDPDLPSLLRRE